MTTEEPQLPEEIEILLAKRLTGEISVSENETLEKHIKENKQLQVKLNKSQNAYQVLLDAKMQMPELQISADKKESLLNIAKASKKAKPLWPTFLAAAIVFFALMISFYNYTSNQSERALNSAYEKSKSKEAVVANEDKVTLDSDTSQKKTESKLEETVSEGDDAKHEYRNNIVAKSVESLKSNAKKPTNIQSGGGLKAKEDYKSDKLQNNSAEAKADGALKKVAKADDASVETEEVQDLNKDLFDNLAESKSKDQKSSKQRSSMKDVESSAKKGELSVAPVVSENEKVERDKGAGRLLDEIDKKSKEKSEAPTAPAEAENPKKLPGSARKEEKASEKQNSYEAKPESKLKEDKAKAADDATLALEVVVESKIDSVETVTFLGKNYIYKVTTNIVASEKSKVSFDLYLNASNLKSQVSKSNLEASKAPTIQSNQITKESAVISFQSVEENETGAGSVVGKNSKMDLCIKEFTKLYVALNAYSKISNLSSADKKRTLMETKLVLENLKFINTDEVLTKTINEINEALKALSAKD